MKHIFLLLFTLCTLSAAETRLVVTPVDGSDYRRELATIGKLTYRHDSLSLFDSGGNLLFQESLTVLRRLTFSRGGDQPTDIQDSATGTALRIYPNPTSSLLFIDLTATTLPDAPDAPTALRLYNSVGQLVQSIAAHTSTTTIDLSDLPADTYILLVGSAAFKVIKNE